MAKGAEFNDAVFNDEVGGTIDRLHQQLDTSLERSVDLHRSGADEEAVLAETAVAVGAAKALEILTGESWETQLQRREEGGAGEAPAPPEPPEPRRLFRRHKAPPE